VRHSWWHNTWNPTWPTEWRQTVALFGWQDYMATGSLALVDNFAAVMENQTQKPCIQAATGLVDFADCARQTGGMGEGAESTLRDIVDWPMNCRDKYLLGDINTVVNAYAVGGLQALASLGQAGGGSSDNLPARSKALEEQANATAAAINSLCVDKSTGLYADGYNTSTRAPLPHSAWHAQVFPAAFGLAPESRWPAILQSMRQKGMAGSVYASYWALKAAYAMDSDHGQLALELLTSCSANSWCNMLKAGATAVMEAWSTGEKPNLSWSHPWASAPASAVVWGLFGIEATSPAFKTFICKPQPGNLSHAAITVPTMSGSITATLEQGSWHKLPTFKVTLDPPAGTTATVCLPTLGLTGNALTVDGVSKSGYLMRDYVCVGGVGSGSAPRVIERGSGPALL